MLPFIELAQKLQIHGQLRRDDAAGLQEPAVQVFPNQIKLGGGFEPDFQPGLRSGEAEKARGRQQGEKRAEQAEAGRGAEEIGRIKIEARGGQKKTGG